MQRSVVRAHPALFNAFTFEVETEHGNRSPSRNHARLHRVQAAQLPDPEVEAELPGPGRVPKVLPLVRLPHHPSGDALTTYGQVDSSAAPGSQGTVSAGARGLAARPPACPPDLKRWGGARAQAASGDGRAPRARLGVRALRPGGLGRAQEGRVAESAGTRQRDGGRA